MTSLKLVLAGTLIAACSSSSKTDTKHGIRAASVACTVGSDCAEGQVCSVGQGCEARGQCVDIDPQCNSLPVARQYCGCDGKTFYHGDCPHSEPCKALGPCESATEVECENRGDCQDGKDCVQGNCQSPPPSGLNAPLHCEKPGDCETGTTCNEGVCE